MTRRDLDWDGLVLMCVVIIALLVLFALIEP